MSKRKTNTEMLLLMLKQEGTIKDEGTESIFKEIFKGMRVRKLFKIYSKFIEFKVK